MPSKGYAQTEEQTSQQAPAQPQAEQQNQQAAAPEPAPDNSQVLASLKQIFAELQNQLQGEARESSLPPAALPPEAEAALDTHNAIVAALTFEPCD